MMCSDGQMVMVHPPGVPVGQRPPPPSAVVIQQPLRPIDGTPVMGLLPSHQRPVSAGDSSSDAMQLQQQQFDHSVPIFNRFSPPQRSDVHRMPGPPRMQPEHCQQNMQFLCAPATPIQGGNPDMQFVDYKRHPPVPAQMPESMMYCSPQNWTGPSCEVAQRRVPSSAGISPGGNYPAYEYHHTNNPAGMLSPMQHAQQRLFMSPYNGNVVVGNPGMGSHSPRQLAVPYRSSSAEFCSPSGVRGQQPAGIRQPCMVRAQIPPEHHPQGQFIPRMPGAVPQTRPVEQQSAQLMYHQQQHHQQQQQQQQSFAPMPGDAPYSQSSSQYCYPHPGSGNPSAASWYVEGQRFVQPSSVNRSMLQCGADQTTAVLRRSPMVDQQGLLSPTRTPTSNPLGRLTPAVACSTNISASPAPAGNPGPMGMVSPRQPCMSNTMMMSPEMIQQPTMMMQHAEQMQMPRYPATMRPAFRNQMFVVPNQSNSAQMKLEQSGDFGGGDAKQQAAMVNQMMMKQAVMAPQYRVGMDVSYPCASSTMPCSSTPVTTVAVTAQEYSVVSLAPSSAIDCALSNSSVITSQISKPAKPKKSKPKRKKQVVPSVTTELPKPHCAMISSDRIPPMPVKSEFVKMELGHEMVNFASRPVIVPYGWRRQVINGAVVYFRYSLLFCICYLIIILLISLFVV